MKYTRKSQTYSQRLSRLVLATAFLGFATWALLPSGALKFLSPTADAANIVVTNTNDSGAGSFRSAILNANGNGNGTIDTITFNIPGAGVHTIKPLTALPAVSTPTVIDGYSQPGASANTLAVGNDAVIQIELDGSLIAGDPEGLVLDAPGCMIKGLAVHSFATGIRMKGNENHVRGNFVGTDPTGSVARPNKNFGIAIEGSLSDIGWTTPADRNIIAAAGTGIGFTSDNSQGNRVFGNYIGTDATGTFARGNAYGISVRGKDHVIGNVTALTRNVISSNGVHGISLSGNNHKVQGNYIGLSATGSGSYGNGTDGIHLNATEGVIIGGVNAGNVIASNGRHGIYVTSFQGKNAENNIIKGNFIGTDAANNALNNTGSGVFLDNSSLKNIVGGTANGESNTIQFNGGDGISARSGSYNNTFSANKIFSNLGIGIDLSNLPDSDGPTPNDVDDNDDGANGLQNYPVLTSAENTGGITFISGTLNSTANSQFTVDFYVSTQCDSSGYGQGPTYLGSATVTTVGTNVAFSKAVPGFHAGQVITATATGPTGGTSEFSQCKQVISPAAGTLQFSSAQFSVNENAAKATITVTRSGGSTGAVTVQYAVTDGGAKSPSDFGADSKTLSFANGESSKTFDVAISDDQVFEGDETVNLALSNATGGASLGNQTTSTLTIVDNEQKPSVSISDVSVTEGNSASTDASFTVTLSGASAQSVSVLFSTADVSAQGGSDYDPVSGTLTFAPGEVSKSVLVPVKGDTDVEPDQTFQVNLSNVIGNTATVADGQGMATIINDDSVAQPSLEFDSLSYSVNEGAGRLDAIVVRSGDSSVPVTITFTTDDGNAKQKSDFNIALGALKFASGETSKTVSIFITDDAYVEGGETFTLSLSSPQGAAVGANSSAIVSIVDNDAAQSANNPADNTAFFLRQHYVDFLNREPEAAGFQGWTDILSNCGAGDSKCDRIEVSSAFFRSQEFQIRGYFAYRFYEASLGRNPSYLEFMADLRRVTGYLSDQQLEEAKVDLVKDFMARQEFKDKYDGIQDAGAYVDALAATAGVTLANRDALVLALQNGQKTRAEILRMVAESQEVGSKFYNKAFVVMQYFGYLRRDPDILYLNWIDTLNQTGDYRTMVNGFLNSLEYRQRFNQ